MRKVMVFGTFDGVHEGHRALFRQAREHGDYLIIALAQDDIVRQLKGSAPRKDIHERTVLLEEEELVDQVVPGDIELGTYLVVEKYLPQVIAVGYDQIALKQDIEMYLRNVDHRIELTVLMPHEPEKYHNTYKARNV